MMATVPEPRSDQIMLIVADNYRLAQLFAHEHNLGREGRSWRYVDHVDKIRGIRNGRYTTISTGAVQGRDLQDRIEVGQYLRALGFEYGLPASSASCPGTADPPG